MEKAKNIKETFMMRIENPFWNETFLENLPRWIHIWVVSISFIGSIMFSINYLKNYLPVNNYIKIFCLITIACTLLLVLNRDTFLPFLSENFLPEIFLNMKVRNPKHVENKVPLKIEPNTKLIYWAADPGKEISKTWKKGYNQFENSGVIKSDKDGNVEIPIQCPSRYIVHGYKVLPKHVHYRTYNEDTQMLSRINTIILNDNQC